MFDSVLSRKRLSCEHTPPRLAGYGGRQAHRDRAGDRSSGKPLWARSRRASSSGGRSKNTLG